MRPVGLAAGIIAWKSEPEGAHWRRTRDDLTGNDDGYENNPNLIRQTIESFSQEFP
jgi:hypothetical protein